MQVTYFKESREGNRIGRIGLLIPNGGHGCSVEAALHENRKGMWVDFAGSGFDAKASQRIQALVVTEMYLLKNRPDLIR